MIVEDNKQYSEDQGKSIEEQRITEEGNPAKPSGKAGAQMLHRMNESHDAVTNWGLDFLTLQSRDVVMDIGCGGGATLHRLSVRGAGYVVGVDYSAVSVHQSLELNQEDVSDGKMCVLQASVEELPFDDEFFDVITTVESFYFWPDPQESLKEVRRVLKQGGHFMLIADIYDNGRLPESARENIRRYQMTVPTAEEYRTLFRNAGFSDVLIHTKNGENWIAVEGIR
ncbi:MAG: class I SAM-dependent methyltransferase [Bilifractor sp.]|nr:class I SAM-dependent methyltransferase [Bilifractor sp.]